MAWEVKKDGAVMCKGESEKSCPSKETAKAMYSAGYRLYIDGKMQKGK